MDETHDEASAARAARLRRRIEEITSDAATEPGEGEPKPRESPRELVHRRMQEIAESERHEPTDPEQDDPEA